MWIFNLEQHLQLDKKLEKIDDLNKRTDERRDRIAVDMEKLPRPSDNSEENLANSQETVNTFDNLQETILNRAFQFDGSVESMTSNNRNGNLQRLLIIKTAWEYAESRKERYEEIRGRYLSIFVPQIGERVERSKRKNEDMIIKHFIDNYSECYLLLKTMKCYLNAMNEKYDLIRTAMRALEVI